jgi:hypothetical protein
VEGEEEEDDKHVFNDSLEGISKKPEEGVYGNINFKILLCVLFLA